MPRSRLPSSAPLLPALTYRPLRRPLASPAPHAPKPRTSPPSLRSSTRAAPYAESTRASRPRSVHRSTAIALFHVKHLAPRVLGRTSERVASCYLHWPVFDRWPGAARTVLRRAPSRRTPAGRRPGPSCLATYVIRRDRLHAPTGQRRPARLGPRDRLADSGTAPFHVKHSAQQPARRAALQGWALDTGRMLPVPVPSRLQQYRAPRRPRRGTWWCAARCRIAARGTTRTDCLWSCATSARGRVRNGRGRSLSGLGAAATASSGRPTTPRGFSPRVRHWRTPSSGCETRPRSGLTAGECHRTTAG